MARFDKYTLLCVVFFIWGFVKESCYTTEMINMAEMKINIREAFNKIDVLYQC